MSEVALQIGGRTYRVACAPGEEARVTGLGATIAEKLASLGNPSGPEAQNLLFAALLLADEVHESREGANGTGDGSAGARQAAEEFASERDRLTARIAALESDQARLQSALKDASSAIAEREADLAAMERQVAGLRADTPSANGVAPVEDMAPALEKFAEILEDCATKLERRASRS